MKLVVEVLNRTPNRDAFCFERIDNGLRRAGAYRLEYVMLPDLPGSGPLTITTEINVVPGPLAQIHLQVLQNPEHQSFHLVETQAHAQFLFDTRTVASDNAASGGQGGPHNAQVGLLMRPACLQCMLTSPSS